MTLSSSIHHLKIERRIHRYALGPEAEFFWGDWMMCQAWIKTDGSFGFQPRGSAINSIEKANAVAIAIRMAIDWVVEEQSRADVLLSNTEPSHETPTAGTNIEGNRS